MMPAPMIPIETLLSVMARLTLRRLAGPVARCRRQIVRIAVLVRLKVELVECILLGMAYGDTEDSASCAAPSAERLLGRQGRTLR